MHPPVLLRHPSRSQVELVELTGVGDHCSEAMLEGRGSQSEVAAEAPTDEDHTIRVHFRYAYGEVDHGDFRRDSDLFGEGVRKPGAQSRIRAAMKRGFQTRDAEMALNRMLGDLANR